MNLIDIAVVLILAYYVVSGYMRGFTVSVLDIASYLLAFILAITLSPAMSGFLMNDTGLGEMLVIYAEGSEYVNNIELASTAITDIEAHEITSAIDSAALPTPFGTCLKANVDSEAFARQGITTLGDYFNMTIVSVVINILSFVLVFFICRLIFSIAINATNYVTRLPVLKQANSWLGMAVGLLRGVLVLYVVFMLLPMLIAVLPAGNIHNLINGYLAQSFTANFFYGTNFLLPLIRCTV